MMHFWFCFLGLLHCVVDGLVVSERNADARVSTVYHFPNNTVSVASMDPACHSSSHLLTTHTQVGRKLIDPVQRQDFGHSDQCASSLADRPSYSVR